LGSAILLAIDFRVKQVGSRYIISPAEAPQVDAILVLGALVRSNGELSGMLRDRLQTGLELYLLNKSSKLLVSGDHGRKEYDEVNAMRTYLEENQVREEDVFMDHAGFSTYESLYRARDIFQVKKVISLRRAIT
jgi:SanA protein